MRFSRPTLGPRTAWTSDQVLADDPTLVGPIDDKLALPPSFGQIYLGEKFSGYLCITNERDVEVRNVRAKVEMQIGGTGTTVNLLKVEAEQLGQGESCQGIAQHDVTQLGAHVLIVTVTFTLQETEESLKKFYKFTALNPLNVRTKVHTTPSFPPLPSTEDAPRWEPSSSNNAMGRYGRKVYLEIQIQNLTHQAINLERLNLDCAPSWLLKETLGATTLMSSPLASKNTLQVLYSLVPEDNQDDHLIRTTPNLGRLDIVWRGVNGETGRLLTSMLGRKVPQHVVDDPLPADISMQVTKAPKSVKREVPFQVELSLRLSMVRNVDAHFTASIETWNIDQVPQQVGSPHPSPSPKEICFPMGSASKNLTITAGEMQTSWTFSWCHWGASEAMIRPGSVVVRDSSLSLVSKLDVVAELPVE